MRESKADRGRRMLLERRLTVERVDPDSGFVVARCRGDSGRTHALGFDPARGEFRCTCEASARFKKECAHLVALKHVVVAGGK